MTSPGTGHFVSNPFSTKFIRAGCLPFYFADDESVDTIRHRLQRARWRGQVVGPHGSGKTTLLRTLDHNWLQWGRRPITISLRDRQRTLPPMDWSSFDSSTQLIVDGFEQLRFLQRLKLLLLCRWRGYGLLVTTHQAFKWTKLPIVATTATSIPLAAKLVSQLMLQAECDSPLESQLIETRYHQSEGNLREMLLSLYDCVGQAGD